MVELRSAWHIPHFVTKKKQAINPSQTHVFENKTERWFVI